MKKDQWGCYSIKGIILTFDFNTLRGKVALVNGEKANFHSTSFDSGSPHRFPKVDEAVSVVFSGKHVVRVHSLKPKDNETIWETE